MSESSINISYMITMRSPENNPLIVKGLTFQNEALNLILTDEHDETYLMELSREALREMFPKMVKLYKTDSVEDIKKMGLLSQDEKIIVEIDLNNKELVDAIGFLPQQIELLNDYTESNKYLELVTKQGLEKEYCLIFMEHIFFHSKDKNEVEKYANETVGIAFVTYYPQL